MITVRTVACIILLLFAAYIAIMNWACVIASELNRRKGIAKHHSTVPLVSFIVAGMFAYPLYPFAYKSWIAIIPLVDIGNWLFLIGLPVAVIRGAFKKEQTPREP
ncbi:MAG: hypothetical protein HYU64_14230 [Armatimonadetes bacterium]|nr:hypothetical protein [Armatimonadota bacterium]